MNSIIKPLIAVMLLAPAVTATAAVPNNTQQRRANLNALRLIEDYESYSTMRNDEAEENFRYIFNNDSAMIYNDVPGLSTDELINIERYIELLKGVRGTRVTVKNITAGPVADGGRVWLMTVTFDKSVQYNTPCGAIIASDDYYEGKDYKMTAVIEVDKDTYESHMRSLSGTMESNRPRLEPGFAIAKKSDPRDLEVTNNGRRLAFNKFDQAFVAQPYNLEFADDDVNMKVIETGDEDCRQLAFEYHPTRWRVRPYANIAMGGAYKVDAPEGVNASNSGMDLGIDFGYIIPSRGKVKVGIFTGVGMSTGKIDLDAASINYNYNAGSEADMDGDTYVRYYELSDMQQSIKMSHFTVPLYADIEYRASRRVSLFAQVGIKAYLNAGSKIDKLSGSVYSYGVYPQYQDLRIDETWLNNFGEATLSLDDMRYDDPFKGFSADLLLGIGARVKLVGPLSLDLGVNYMNPLIDRMESNDLTPLPSGNTTAAQAPVTYTVAGGQVSNNPLSNYCKIKSNPLKVKVGLTFKF